MIRNIFLGLLVGLLAGFLVFDVAGVGDPDSLIAYCDGYAQGGIDTVGVIYGPPPMDYPGPIALHDGCLSDAWDPMVSMDIRDIMPMYYPPPSR